MSDAIRLPLPDGLRDRIDAVRGDTARVVWIRRAIERALADKLPSSSPDAQQKALARVAGHQPGPNVENIRSSGQSKRDVKPRPKGAG